MAKVAVLLMLLVVAMATLEEASAGRRGNGKRHRGGKNRVRVCDIDLTDKQKWRKLGGAKSHLKTLAEAKDPSSEVNCPVANYSVISKWQSLNERATAPWDYVIDHDPNRFPTTIPQARCLCQGCIDVYEGVEDTRMNSVPLTYTIKVLYRRGCDSNGKYKYRAKEIKVKVGCTCAVPRLRLVE